MPAIYDTFDRIHGRILIHICCGTLFVRAAQHTGQSDLDENPRAARPEHYLHSAAATTSFFFLREKNNREREAGARNALRLAAMIVMDRLRLLNRDRGIFLLWRRSR
jgi:hypothetical protein